MSNRGSQKPTSSPTEGRNSFGNGKRKRGSRRLQLIVMACSLLILVISLLALVVAWQYGDQDPSGGKVAAVFDEDAFDPIKDFAAIRDKGTPDQMQTLASALKNQRISNQPVPVKLDNLSKIIEISGRMLEHPAHTESHRAWAAKAKLDAYWKTYIVNVENNLDDPFIAEQYLGAAEEFLDDSDRSVSREAHLGKARVLVYETIQKKFLGSFEGLSESLRALLDKFSDEPQIIERVKQLFIEVRKYNADQSTELANQLAALAESKESPELVELAQFFKDIILLYDSGIGNSRRIKGILVEDEVFQKRLFDLNDVAEAGLTVVAQLDNAIDYFERSKNYDAAIDLCQKMLANVDQRTNQEAAKWARTWAEQGQTRSALPGKVWDFSANDVNGRPMIAERFVGRVVIVTFVNPGQRDSQVFLSVLATLYNRTVGRDVEFIVVEVDSNDDDKVAEAQLQTPSGARWSILKMDLASPNGYWKQCPVSRFPYVLLIDKTGKVDSINLQIEEFKTRLESLISKKEDP